MAKTEAVSTTNTPGGGDGAVPVSVAKSKKKLIIILVAAILLLSSIGAAAWWFLKPAPKKPVDEGDKSAISKSEPAKLPIFVALETFTVNLADTDYDRFLHVVIQLEVKDEKVSSLLKTYDPAIRHRFLFLISTANSEVLKTPEGKQALAQQLTLVANQVLRGAPGNEGADPVIGTSFTTFMIQ
jgi:flagellar FliL protein